MASAVREQRGTEAGDQLVFPSFCLNPALWNSAAHI